MFSSEQEKLSIPDASMSKGIGLMTLSLLLVSPILHAKTEYFVGAGVGYQEDKLDGANSTNGEDATVLLNGGLTINSEHRVTATYSYKDKFSQSLFFASYDYLYDINNRVSLNGGFLLGVGYNDIVGETSMDFIRGLQVGTTYHINKDWSTDLTYRYLHQDFDERDVEIDYTQQVVIMANYHF
ncbi:porin family protein [Photobacterium rosenbergii]|uniref:porin family protein n=1 Tax=Photobacterium rosenbergii TaxID=294936 RepID=UPI001C9A1911|nr:porin family protein [Photobacterium rosenbergii]MBY5944759.1 porin family protein [Photobacterium rosenbergii]